MIDDLFVKNIVGESMTLNEHAMKHLQYDAGENLSTNFKAQLDLKHEHFKDLVNK